MVVSLKMAQTRRQTPASTPAHARHGLQNLQRPLIQLLLQHRQGDGHEAGVSVITKLHFHRVHVTTQGR
jgi:hypothetical protein